MELLLGCGSSRERRIKIQGRATWCKLVRLDWNADHKPDVVYNLEKTPYPFAADTFDEIHAYEVLEHIGQQGDHLTFFAQFSELWRILKPDGFLAATCPSWQSMWAWGDPSHRRILCPGSLVFLSQAEYAKQVGKTPMSDFRFCYKADFRTVFQRDDGEVFTFVIQAKKGLDKIGTHAVA